MALRPDEIERYARQVVLPEWGAERQDHILGATVAVSGQGDAAEAAIRYLTAAGVGRLVVTHMPEIVKPINARAQVAVFPGDRVPGASVVVRTAAGLIAGDEDRFVVGAAVAVEALKSLLGLPHQDRVSVPRLDPEPGPADAPPQAQAQARRPAPGGAR